MMLLNVLAGALAGVLVAGMGVLVEPEGQGGDAKAGPVAVGAVGVGVGVVPAAGALLRVGGDEEAKVKREGEGFFIGKSSITTPLPVGYPDPTPPGAIDLKTYPSVRRAEVSGELAPDMATNVAFFPLFSHIQRRNIEMTSPVEVDYVGMVGGGAQKGEEAKGEGAKGDAAGAEGDKKPGSWTMSFLYRRADQGPTGPDERNGAVKVVDTEPVTVLAIGIRGGYSVARIGQGLKELELWLAEHPEWEIAGEARAMYYNGPDVRNAEKWSEAQVPVRLKKKAEGK